MRDKTKGLIMQIPVFLILLVLVIGSFFVWIKEIPVNNGKPASFMTPLTILVFVALYVWGRIIENKDHSFF